MRVLGWCLLPNHWHLALWPRKDGDFERGQELERRSSSDAQEILYRVFESVTFAMANAYELRNRRAGEDNRRQLFSVQLELFGKLSAAWRQRTRVRLDEVLSRNPFRDVDPSAA